jgi:hypothetical protein
VARPAAAIRCRPRRRSHRPARRLPVRVGQVAQRPGGHGRDQGPGARAERVGAHQGRNRFGFALFDTRRKQITGAAVAIYTARNDGSGLRGPYVARSESLAVKPQFQSKTTATDPDAAKAVYVADVPFKANGKRIVIGLARLDGPPAAHEPLQCRDRRPQRPAAGGRPGDPHPHHDAGRRRRRRLAARHAPPGRHGPAAGRLRRRPGQAAGRDHVRHAAAVPEPRVRPGRRRRRAGEGDRAQGRGFIHQEIYNDNSVDKGYRPQVGAWRLPTEPWTFVVGRDGRIAERFQGAFSAGELQRAVAAAAR